MLLPRRPRPDGGAYIISDRHEHPRDTPEIAAQAAGVNTGTSLTLALYDGARINDWRPEVHCG